jgi:hypothetical protein
MRFTTKWASGVGILAIALAGSVLVAPATSEHEAGPELPVAAGRLARSLHCPGAVDRESGAPTLLIPGTTLDNAPALPPIDRSRCTPPLTPGADLLDAARQSSEMASTAAAQARLATEPRLVRYARSQHRHAASTTLRLRPRPSHRRARPTRHPRRRTHRGGHPIPWHRRYPHHERSRPRTRRTPRPSGFPHQRRDSAPRARGSCMLAMA